MGTLRKRYLYGFTKALAAHAADMLAPKAIPPGDDAAHAISPASISAPRMLMPALLMMAMALPEARGQDARSQRYDKAN